MFLALRAHCTAVVPVEVVQVGVVFVGLLGGVCGATGIVAPGGTLEREKGSSAVKTTSIKQFQMTHHFKRLFVLCC